MQNFHKFVLVVCLLFCTNTALQSQPVAYGLTVYTNGYKGHLAISGHERFFFLHGDTTLAINPDLEGKYYLNTGASIGDRNSLQTSNIYLLFDKAGLIDSIYPKLSATIGKDRKSINLNTAAITINPGKFTREWYPSFGVDKIGFYCGKKTVQLIKGQTYNIDNSHSGLYTNCRCDTTTKPCKLIPEGYHASYFYFTVLENGQLNLYDANSASASALGNTLKFKTVRVTLDPAELSGGATLLIPKPASQTLAIAKKAKSPFIRGTVNYVYWHDATGKEVYFYFLPM